MLAIAGPGFLVAVGYMDPGDWVTAIAGRSALSYTLLSVALLSPWRSCYRPSPCVLVLSQVILSLQLPFAIVPLVAFTANRKLMNGLPAPHWQTLLCALIALVIIILNIDVATGAV